MSSLQEIVQYFQRISLKLTFCIRHISLLGAYLHKFAFFLRDDVICPFPAEEEKEDRIN